ncbi:MAG: N-6 DNA methylase [Muribaculaceae bacterium]|nr:N-6 DNA methylase [Muribaculaceae bacterium]
MKEQLQHIFQNGYPGSDVFIEKVLKPMFSYDVITNIDIDIIDSHEKRRRADNANILSAIHVADIDRVDSDPIALYDVTLSPGSNIAHSRVAIKQFIASEVMTFTHAFILFHYHNEAERPWRFSYVYKERTTSATRAVAKRYTYVFGKDYRSRTAIERFIVLARSPKTDEDFARAFSVETLSDEFFDRYRELYADFVQYITGKRYVKESGKLVEKKIHDANPQLKTSFDGNDKLVRDYIKKMFGRIVFLYFLQRKGWLAGNRQYMHDLFYNSELQDNFLDSVLEPLFFGVLNTRHEHRLADNASLPDSDKIPYLNGGLFQQDEIDERTCVLPADLFKRLFDFFDQYNFTIDENDPEDAEVGIDPEMLGRIFENLLEDNKDKGAFYTPKEIVDYMCRESIIAYLLNGIPERSHELIRNFVETLDADSLNNEQRTYLAKKLVDVKICDPAIGSGAFPMGIINILSKIYLALGPVHDRSKMKRHIMEQNIYGVDIEKGAVDIARLRFWLAMVVDAKEPEPLPNLHFKIMQGNSLLETYEGFDLTSLIKPSPDMLDFVWSEAEAQMLQNRLAAYYGTTDHRDRDRIAREIHDSVMRQLLNAGIPEEKLVGLDPSSNEKFFLWHTWFANVFKNGGFDIVIGNPPFGASISKTDKELYRKLYPETEFKIDTYALFLLLSFKLLKEKGVLYYIIPNTILDNYFEETVRKKLLSKRVLELNDLSDSIFENAIVHSMILGFQNTDMTSDYTIKCDIGERIVDDVFYVDASFFTKQQKTLFSIRSWATRAIYEKLAFDSVNLQDVLNIRQAIKSGDDKKYIVNEQLSNEYKPILRGKDVKRFFIEKPNLYLHYGSFLACPRTPDIFEQPKILIREAGAKITAAIDYDNNYIMSSLYNCILTSNEYSLEYILGLINSELFQHLMNKLTFEKTKGAFTKAKIYHYYELPVRKASKAIQDKIGTLVNHIMAVAAKGEIFNELELQLNLTVYHLYHLTYDEVLIVDPETPISREEYESFNLYTYGQL